MRRWILPLVLLLVAAVGGWQAVRTDEALASRLESSTGVSAPAAQTPLLSIRRTPEFLRQPTILSNLRGDLETLAADFPTLSCLVVSVDGEEIFSKNPTLPLVPASAQKIITAYAVYEILEADSAFETRVVSNASLVDGVLDGDLWLVGGGDPLLATEQYVARYDEPEAFTDLEILADAVVAAGITEITGGVIGDDGRYDDERYLLPEWPERFVEQNQTGPLSALTVNDGFVRYDATNTAPSLATPARQPAAFAASFFDDLLEARDVTIRGVATAGASPAAARDLVDVLVSNPLATVTNQMVSISDNMAAELLVKEIGLATSGEGSTDAGTDAIESFLKGEFAAREINVVDGSGLADGNKVTCRLLVDVLDASRGSNPLIDGLAIAGRTGTLRERLVGTAAEGRVAAKTGRLNEVGALAGIASAGDGTELTFAWIGNTTDFYDLEAMLATQDGLAIELVEYPEGPSIDSLSPIG